MRRWRSLAGDRVAAAGRRENTRPSSHEITERLSGHRDVAARRCGCGVASAGGSQSTARKTWLHLQRKIAAYRQLNHDTTGQLYSVLRRLSKPTSAASTRPCANSSSSATTLDRLQFVAQRRRRSCWGVCAPTTKVHPGRHAGDRIDPSGEIQRGPRHAADAKQRRWRTGWSV